MRQALCPAMPVMRGFAIGLMLLVGAAGAQDLEPSGAAESDSRQGRALGLGVALGAGRMGVGDDSSSTFVAGVVARLGLDSRNRFQLIGELYPIAVDSPVIDESFTSANVLLGYTFGGESFRIRPVVGAQLRWWTGSQRVTSFDWGPLLGLDAGPELRLSDTLSLSPEVVLRWSLIEVEGNVGSSFVGVQCVLSWRGASPTWRAMTSRSVRRRR